MKTIRNLFAVLLLVAVAAACDLSPTAPGHDDNPAIGSGTGT